MYDELNVKNTRILNRRETDEKEIIDVEIISRYMDYIIDKNTLEYKRGNNTRRIQKNNYLTFSKKIATDNLNISRKCLSCGADVNINNSGKCVYCGSIFPLENYDYILIDIEV